MLAFVDTHGWPGGVIVLKNRFFPLNFFLKRRALNSASTIYERK